VRSKDEARRNAYLLGKLQSVSGWRGGIDQVLSFAVIPAPSGWWRMIVIAISQLPRIQPTVRPLMPNLGNCSLLRRRHLAGKKCIEAEAGELVRTRPRRTCRPRQDLGR
jgi:hypothetical protein